MTAELPREDKLAAELREWMVNTPGEPDVNALLRRAADRLDEFHAIAADVLFYVEQDDGVPVLAAVAPDDEGTEHRYTTPGGQEFVLLPVIDDRLMESLVALAYPLAAVPSTNPPEPS